MVWLNEHRRLSALGAGAAMIVWAWIAFGPWPSFKSSADAAAWVQAIGSILAIVVSAAFAILAPLHVRDLDAKAEAQRAVNNATYLVGLARANWLSFEGALHEGQFGPLTARALRSEIARAQTLAREVPHSLMLPTAFTVVSTCIMSLDLLAIVLDEIEQQKSVDAVMARFDLARPLADLQKSLDVADELSPVRAIGTWMMGGPKDMTGS